MMKMRLTTTTTIDGAGNLVVDDEHYEDAQEVIDSFQSSKRERFPGGSSDSCDDSSH